MSTPTAPLPVTDTHSPWQAARFPFPCPSMSGISEKMFHATHRADLNSPRDDPGPVWRARGCCGLASCEAACETEDSRRLHRESSGAHTSGSRGKLNGAEGEPGCSTVLTTRGVLEMGWPCTAVVGWSEGTPSWSGMSCRLVWGGGEGQARQSPQQEHPIGS